LKLLKSKPNAKILDLGTGSGNIPVALAHSIKGCHVTSVDISADAIEIAKKNAGKHKVETRIDFVQGDLFAPLPKGSKFDLIVSNPPYVTEAEFQALSPGVKDFEPKLALLAGADGLDFYRRIAEAAPEYLQPGGTILLEIGSTQGDAVKELLTKSGFLETRILLDGARLPRVVFARGR
jgi:release factor glutamine methyltransferase